MAYIPQSGSVVAFQSDPTKLQVTASVAGVVAISNLASVISIPNNSSFIGVQQGSVATVIIGGSIAASFTPPANQSVSGTVNILTNNTSVITLIQSSVAAIVSGDVANKSTDTGNPIKIGGYASANVPSAVGEAQRVNGWFGLSGQMMAANIVGNSPGADGSNQNGLLTQNSSTANPTGAAGYVYNGNNWDRARGNSSIGALVSTGQSSVIVLIQGSVATSGGSTGNSSVQVLNFPTNQNVSGSVIAFQGSGWSGSVAATVTNTNLNVGGSVVAFQGGTQITSVVGAYTEPNVVTSITGMALVFKSNISSSVMSGVSVANPLPVSVQGVVQISGNPSISGTVNLAGNPSVSGQLGASVIGTVPTTQTGTWVSSIVNTVPSSVLVGASIFGQLPAGTAVLGSIAALQATNPWNIAGSVAALQAGTWNPSVTGIIPLTGITNLGKQVASVFGNTDVGVATLSYRNDALASVAGANKQYNVYASDSAGRTIIKPFISEDGTVIRYSGSIVSGSVTLIKASAVGLKNYITDFWIANTGSVGTLVTFKDGSTSVVGYAIAPTLGGISSPGLAVPLVTAVSQDLTFVPITPTSVLYLTVNGYQAP